VGDLLEMGGGSPTEQKAKVVEKIVTKTLIKPIDFGLSLQELKEMQA